MRRLAALSLACGLLAPYAAFADSIPLPKAEGEIPIPREAVADRPERLRRSEVPGRIDDVERVDVGIGPDGGVAAVSMTQRFTLHGTGQYVIWQRSSAQDAVALDDTSAPVLKREAVIWQGFVNERKELAAVLTLDPRVESELLPLRVEVSFTNGRLGPAGAVPAPGEVVVRITNRTTVPMTLPTGTVPARSLAKPLDTLRRYAAAKRSVPPPSAGRGLPATLPVTGKGQREANVVAPFRVRGLITATGGTATTPESPAARHVPGGLRLDGVLSGAAEFRVAAPGPGTLALDLTAFPTLDPRTLEPPQGRTWAEWASRRPPASQVAAATTQLVDAAAAAARADHYAPYLGHHGPGKVRTTFRYRLAKPAALRALPDPPLQPRPLGIALATVALLGIVTNAAALWRRL